MELKFDTLPLYFPMGDKAVIIQFEREVSIKVCKYVQYVARKIKLQNITGVSQVLSSFNNVIVYYDPIRINYYNLLNKLQVIESEQSPMVETVSKGIVLPVVFGKEFGPDLNYVSKVTNISMNEIIDILLSTNYFVYMIGLIGGFPYSGDIDSKLRLPRLSNPKPKVEKGSVLIANSLTGVFPMSSPSGWHTVGWTPMEIFSPYSELPSLISVGDYIKYHPIDERMAINWDEKHQRKWDEEWNHLK